MPSSSTVRTSESGTGRPTEPSLLRPGGLVDTSALVSVRPYPSRISTPGTRLSKACTTSSARGDAPETMWRRVDRSYSSSGSANSICSMDGTTAATCTLCLDEPEEVRGIEPPSQHGDTLLHRVHADRREKPVGMRQRQWDDGACNPRNVAGLVAGLARVPQVVVSDHHALGRAGRTAGEHQRGEVRVVARHDLAGLGLLQRREGDDAIDVVAGRQDLSHGARVARGCLHGGQNSGEVTTAVASALVRMCRRSSA